MVGGADERFLSLTFPPAISFRASLTMAQFTTWRYASSAKSASEGQKRGRCDIRMSHEERFPSPNAESALGRNCTGERFDLLLSELHDLLLACFWEGLPRWVFSWGCFWGGAIGMSLFLRALMGAADMSLLLNAFL